MSEQKFHCRFEQTSEVGRYGLLVEVSDPKNLDHMPQLWSLMDKLSRETTPALTDAEQRLAIQLSKSLPDPEKGTDRPVSIVQRIQTAGVKISINGKTIDPVDLLIQRLKETTDGVDRSDYVPLECSEDISFSTRDGLETKLNAFLDSKKSVLLLLGDSGSGKSTFMHRLPKFLGEKQPDLLTILIPLNHALFVEKGIRLCIEHYLMRRHFGLSLEQISFLRHQRQKKWVFLFDGYDEIPNNPHVNLYQTNELAQWHDAKLIVTCRTQYLKTRESYKTLFVPKDNAERLRYDIYQELYVAPFSPQQVSQYFTQAKQEAKIDQTFVKELNVGDLLSNPLILYFFTESALELKKTLENSSQSRLNRTAIYKAFITKWFKRQLSKLTQAAGISDIKEEDFVAFARGLARKMLFENVSKIEIKDKSALSQTLRRYGSKRNVFAEPVTESLWKVFFDEKKEKNRMACPLKRIGENEFSFLHKSVQSYFAVEHLYALLGPNNSDISLQDCVDEFNRGLWVNESDIMGFMVEQLEMERSGGERASYEAKENLLFEMVKTSKNKKAVEKAAANAITVLNRLGVCFSGKDFSDVNIGGADLSGAMLDHTCFKGANLEGVDLSKAFLRETDFRKAVLKDIVLGERPSLKFGSGVDCLSYSKDGRWLAVGVYRGDIGVWDIQGGTESPMVFKGHGDKVTSVAFDATGQWLASGSEDQTIRLWSLAEKKNKYQADAVLEGHGDKVTSVAFDGKGEWLASGSWDQTIRLWSLAEKKDKNQADAVLEGHGGYVSSVAFDGKGQWLASGSEDKTIRLWSLAEKKDKNQADAVLEGHGGYVSSVAFDATGQWLASGSWDGTVRLWSMAEKKNKDQADAVLAGHGDNVMSVAFDATGQWLASGSWDGTVRLWSMAEKKNKDQADAVLAGHGDKVMSVAFDGKGEWLASGSEDKTIRLWSVAEKKNRKQADAVLDGNGDWVTSVAFDATGQWLASGGGMIRLWSVAEKKDRNQADAVLEGHGGYVSSVAFDAKGQWLASGSWDRTVRLWSMAEKKNKDQADAVLEGHGNWVMSVAFDASGQWLASGSRDKTIRLWSLAEKKDKNQADAVLEGHGNWVMSVAFDGKGEWLASGSEDKTIRLWSVAEKKDKKKADAVLKGHGGYVSSVAFDAKGQWLASGSWDRTVRLWSLAEKKNKDQADAVLAGHGDRVTSVAFDATGQWLASGSKDKTIRLWSLAEKKDKKKADMVLEGHGDKMMSVAFDVTGQWLASGSEDKSILLWRHTEAGIWQAVRRMVAHPVLTAPGAQLEGAIIDDSNCKLLKERGAKTLGVPAVTRGPQTTDAHHSFNLSDSTPVASATTPMTTGANTPSSSTPTTAGTSNSSSSPSSHYSSPVSQPTSFLGKFRSRSDSTSSLAETKKEKKSEKHTKQLSNSVLPEPSIKTAVQKNSEKSSSSSHTYSESSSKRMSEKPDKKSPERKKEMLQRFHYKKSGIIKDMSSQSTSPKDDGNQVGKQQSHRI